jgi:hypothetical protein
MKIRHSFECCPNVRPHGKTGLQAARRKHMKRYIAPSVTKPKSSTRQRVRASAEGVKWLIAPAGTEGEVVRCGLVVTVLWMGPSEKPSSRPNFWEAA